MKIDWKKSEADKLAEMYKSFVINIKAKSLKRLVLKGMENFIAFPGVCRNAVSAATQASEALKHKFQSPELRKAIHSLSMGDMRIDPVDLIDVANEIEELSRRLDEMQSQKDEFFQQYSTLFEGALDETIQAAKALIARVEGKDFVPEFTKSVLLDAGGALLPGLGTVVFLKQRVLEKSKYLHSQLQKSAGVADSFVVFSEFMDEVTQQMKAAELAVVEDASVLADFVDVELPGRIERLTKKKNSLP